MDLSKIIKIYDHDEREISIRKGLPADKREYHIQALFVRISATDWVDGGWNPEESVRLSGILKLKGIDLMDISSGGLSRFRKFRWGRHTKHLLPLKLNAKLEY